MATRIRLQRHGRKGYAFYHVVVADSRAPRDGKFIERIGSYNPNTNPATIDLNFERALHWLQVGALPTDTARMILSREGVCLKKHLLDGMKKGAFDEAAAETKFQEWLTKKKMSLQAVTNKERETEKAIAKTLLDAEKEVNKAKSAALSQKKAELSVSAAKKAAEVSETEETETEVNVEVNVEVTAAETAEIATEVNNETPVAETSKTESIE